MRQHRAHRLQPLGARKAGREQLQTVRPGLERGESLRRGEDAGEGLQAEALRLRHHPGIEIRRDDQAAARIRDLAHLVHRQ
jgi:hypothetical protein